MWQNAPYRPSTPLLDNVRSSPNLYQSQFPDLEDYFSTNIFGKALVYGGLYALSSGTAHSAQYAVHAILKAANNGELNITEKIKAYGDTARRMKRILMENGFRIVYDRDGEKPIADGFYFTLSYPGFSGPELVEALLYYGISAIPLVVTGSRRREGLRACVSQVSPGRIREFKHRIRQFHMDHPLKTDTVR